LLGRFNGEVKHQCIERYGKDAVREVCRKWNIADADCEDDFVKDVVDHILPKDAGLKCHELDKTFKKAAKKLAEDAADTKCTNVFSSAEDN
jgi:bisphosphoglycerate-dependent phosphoglycerate mutase